MNTTTISLLVLAALIGALIPFQAGANVQAAKVLPGPVHGAALNFVAGGVALLIMAIIVAPRLPSAAQMASAPWWAWLGGLMGAAFVFGTVMLAPRMGTVLFLAATVAGQLVASLCVDHFGWVGLAQRAATPGRLAGVAVVIAGLVIIQLSTPPAGR